MKVILPEIVHIRLKKLICGKCLKESHVPEIPHYMENERREKYLDDIIMLEKMIGRDLTRWKYSDTAR